MDTLGVIGAATGVMGLGLTILLSLGQAGEMRRGFIQLDLRLTDIEGYFVARFDRLDETARSILGPLPSN